jgi:pre-rRNA-processing protein TSR4
MALLLQLNGELPERFPGHERRIYVFGCRRSTCRRRDGTIRAVRGVRVWKEEAAQPSLGDTEAQEGNKEEQPKVEEKKPALGEALFGASSFRGGASAANPFSSGGGGGGANPFSTSSSAAANPFSTSKPKESEIKIPEKPVAEEKSTAALSKTFAETLSLNTPPTEPPPPAEPWPEDKALPNAYPTLYLADADYETLDPTPIKVPENARVEAADAEEPSVLDREAFESTMDAAFQKFADRLSQNPEQVIRYEFGGTPLLYSKTDAIGQKVLSGSGLPGCPNCGGRRTFEVQLTPNAIAELEQDDLSLEGMEWGTVIVGVCERDCSPRTTEFGEAGYLEEWVGVQWEELVNRK